MISQCSPLPRRPSSHPILDKLMWHLEHQCKEPVKIQFHSITWDEVAIYVTLSRANSFKNKALYEKLINPYSTYLLDPEDLIHPQFYFTISNIEKSHPGYNDSDKIFIDVAMDIETAPLIHISIDSSGSELVVVVLDDETIPSVVFDTNLVICMSNQGLFERAVDLLRVPNLVTFVYQEKEVFCYPRKMLIQLLEMIMTSHKNDEENECYKKPKILNKIVSFRQLGYVGGNAAILLINVEKLRHCIKYDNYKYLKLYRPWNAKKEDPVMFRPIEIAKFLHLAKTRHRENQIHQNQEFCLPLRA